MNAATIKKIDELFRDWDKPDSPGFSLAVVERGKTVYARGYGMASLEQGVPISPETVFDIGSTTKQFVAFCIALLEKRGKLSLNDEVVKYIPELARYKYPVRIHHLIFHTSGIRDYLALMALAGMRFENEYPDTEIMALVTRQKQLNFKPGEEFLYSNSGYLLLGEIIKRVSGRTLREFAEKNIFAPLGMRNTHFHDDFTEVIRNKAAGYSLSGGAVKADISLFDAVGDGGVNTTTGDLALWDRNFYHNTLGGGQALIERITAPGRLNNGRALDYAHGLFLTEYRGQRMILHGGAWVGYRSELLRFPRERFSVICLANFTQAKPTYIAKQVADICLGGRLTGPVTPVAKAASDKGRTKAGRNKISAGFYFNEESGRFLEISAENGKCFLRDDESRYELSAAGAGRFAAVAGAREAAVERVSSTPPALILKKLNVPLRTYVRIRPEPVKPGALRGFEGDYYSAELGVYYRVKTAAGKLFLEPDGAQKEELRLVKGRLFSGGSVSVEFGAVGARRGKDFMLNSGRVRGVVFVRKPRGT